MRIAQPIWSTLIEPEAEPAKDVTGREPGQRGSAVIVIWGRGAADEPPTRPEMPIMSDRRTPRHGAAPNPGRRAMIIAWGPVATNDAATGSELPIMDGERECRDMPAPATAGAVPVVGSWTGAGGWIMPPAVLSDPLCRMHRS